MTKCSKVIDQWSLVKKKEAKIIFENEAKLFNFWQFLFNLV
jgi:hypothetical protein